MRFEWHYGPADVYTNDKLYDIVSAVHWWCVGFAPDGTNYKESGSISLPPPDPSKFTNFSNITAAQVKDWVESNLDKLAVENKIIYEYNNRNTSGVKNFAF